MSSRAFQVVKSFEEAVAEYAGAPYGVAVDSCTTALFLSCLYVGVTDQEIEIPARTYISVPAGIIRAGGRVRFTDKQWEGAYSFFPPLIIDSALRFQRDMYWSESFYCLSFHARKHLKIGRGGMILTDDKEAAEWFRKARLDGRDGSIPFMLDKVEELGFNAYMTPEQAARGLQLLEAMPGMNPDLTPDYPDLRTMPVFNAHPVGT